MKLVIVCALLVSAFGDCLLCDTDSVNVGGTCSRGVVPLLVSYSSGATDHFYVTDQAEFAGFYFPYPSIAIACNIWSTQLLGTVPLFRTWNPVGLDHFYTTNVADFAYALTHGYNYELITGYVYPTQVPGTVRLFRLYNPYIVDHFYTTSITEVIDAILKLGYLFEVEEIYVAP